MFNLTNGYVTLPLNDGLASTSLGYGFSQEKYRLSYAYFHNITYENMIDSSYGLIGGGGGDSLGYFVSEKDTVIKNVTTLTVMKQYGDALSVDIENVMIENSHANGVYTYRFR